MVVFFQNVFIRDSFYMKSFIAGIIFMTITVYTLGVVGKLIARRQWLPIITEKQGELSKIAGEIIVYEGFTKEQFEDKDRYSDKQHTEYSQMNYEKADQYLAQIEDLLEIKDTPVTRQDKHSNLSKYFNKKD